MRVKFFRVEGFGQLLVTAHIVHIVGAPAVNPVFGTKAPAFHNTPLAVCAPVHHEAEFEVLPFCKFLLNERIRIVDIWVFLGIQEMTGGNQGKSEDEKSQHDKSWLVKKQHPFRMF